MIKRIVVTGSPDRMEEFRERIPKTNIQYTSSESIPYLDLGPSDVLFDLDLDEHPDHITLYGGYEGLTVVGCAVRKSLAELQSASKTQLACSLIGMNSLPGFINRPDWEFSLLNPSDKGVVDDICEHLGVEGAIIADRVGMVTPRILFMIINEASFVLQEGTASIADVDSAMRLGTNYPMGPFEWADKIGIHHVYEVLSSLKDDTGEGRYKIAPLLKQYYLKKLRFYP
jgi:3-hydroxybutyryl-CoA dehydrogenase